MIHEFMPIPNSLLFFASSRLRVKHFKPLFYFTRSREGAKVGRSSPNGGCFLRALFAVAVIFFDSSPMALAGGGPENLFLVVNSKSAASKTVANHYIQLRQIPPQNVLEIPWDGSLETTPVETFREKILSPIINTLAQRKLLGQIDYVVYSSDFPYAIDLTADLRGQKPPTQVSPTASITGATYFWQHVLAKSPNVIGLQNNHYMRHTTSAVRDKQTRGFRNWQGWSDRGLPVDVGGNHYLLSVMLAYTSGRGNSLAEVENYLKRSAAADGKAPRGNIYYLYNDDIRSKTRQFDPRTKADQFQEAVDELKRLGVSAVSAKGVMPTGRDDVQGVLMGTALFNWKDSKSTILPGAICDNLTSFGGILSTKAGQTPLSEYLRHGAAGASGTVVEPYALQDKFPFPLIHVHYARGCTLAEAFYQSVFGPYQLLIVGDPLCRPWAKIPTVSVKGVAPGATVKETLQLRPDADLAGRAARVARYELFVDGLRHERCKSGGTLELDTTEMLDGHHELRIVSIEDSPIETQGRKPVSITVDNHSRARTAKLTSSATKTARWGQSLILALKSPGAKGALFMLNTRLLGTAQGTDARLKLDPESLGEGPVTLRAIAIGADGKPWAVAAPLELTIQR